MGHLVTTYPDAGRAEEILRRIPRDRPVIGAEIGTYRGELAEVLLREAENLTLYCVDVWAPLDDPTYRETGDYQASHTVEEWAAAYRDCRQRLAFAGDRARLLKMPSNLAAIEVPDRSLDFAFIDANHSYEACLLDIGLWRHRVREDGWIGGHDYGHWNEKYGVTRAVDEFAKAMGQEVMTGKDYTWFVGGSTFAIRSPATVIRPTRGPKARRQLRRLCRTVCRHASPPLRVVELGCYAGVGSVIFLEFFQQVTCVDRWTVYDGYSDSALAKHTPSEWATVKTAFDRRTKAAVQRGRLRVLQMDTIAARGQVKTPQTLVYLDADHSEQSVGREIDVWMNLAQFIGGHDFSKRFPGVIAAVTKRFASVQRFGAEWLVKLT